MKSLFRHAFGRHVLRHRSPSPPWNDTAPVREDLFGVERLELHAESLAAAQAVTSRPPAVLSLHARLNNNATVLLAAYRASAAELERGQGVVPAAEWLLDNYHLVEEQIREIRDDLPPSFYRQLPKLAEGPFAAYQRVQPLTIGELWTVAITLRIVLIENLRRLADQITVGREARACYRTHDPGKNWD